MKCLNVLIVSLLMSSAGDVIGASSSNQSSDKRIPKSFDAKGALLEFGTTGSEDPLNRFIDVIGIKLDENNIKEVDRLLDLALAVESNRPKRLYGTKYLSFPFFVYLANRRPDVALKLVAKHPHHWRGEVFVPDEYRGHDGRTYLSYTKDLNGIQEFIDLNVMPTVYDIKFFVAAKDFPAKKDILKLLLVNSSAKTLKLAKQIEGLDEYISTGYIDAIMPLSRLFERHFYRKIFNCKDAARREFKEALEAAIQNSISDSLLQQTTKMASLLREAAKEDQNKKRLEANQKINADYKQVVNILAAQSKNPMFVKEGIIKKQIPQSSNKNKSSVSSLPNVASSSYNKPVQAPGANNLLQRTFAIDESIRGYKVGPPQIQKRMSAMTPKVNVASSSSSSNQPVQDLDLQRAIDESMHTYNLEQIANQPVSTSAISSEVLSHPEKPIMVLPDDLKEKTGVAQIQLSVEDDEPIEYESFEGLYDADAEGGVLKLQVAFTQDDNKKWHYAFYFPNDQLIAVGKEDPVSRQPIQHILMVELGKSGNAYTLK